MARFSLLLTCSSFKESLKALQQPRIWEQSHVLRLCTPSCHLFTLLCVSGERCQGWWQWQHWQLCHRALSSEWTPPASDSVPACIIPAAGGCMTKHNQKALQGPCEADWSQSQKIWSWGFTLYAQLSLVPGEIPVRRSYPIIAAAESSNNYEQPMKALAFVA